jgi:hypothetical protein
MKGIMDQVVPAVCSFFFFFFSFYLYVSAVLVRFGSGLFLSLDSSGRHSRAEIQLPETENPQTWVMSNAAVAATASSTSSTTNSINGGSTERNCTFAFRRQDAKIAWPRQING